MKRILDIITLYIQYANKPPCKKTVQKINYLLQEANKNYEYDYCIHFYGPYSADLDMDMLYLYKRGEIDINYSNQGHLLSLTDITHPVVFDDAIENRVAYFSEKNPSHLELLATTLYVQREINNTDASAIMDVVVKIKKKKYSESKIYAAIIELNELSYF